MRMPHDNQCQLFARAKVHSLDDTKNDNKMIIFAKFGKEIFSFFCEHLWCHTFMHACMS